MITNCKDFILRGSLPKKEKVDSEDEEDDSEEDN
jgi:hypothetical protein